MLCPPVFILRITLNLGWVLGILILNFFVSLLICKNGYKNSLFPLFMIAAEIYSLLLLLLLLLLFRPYFI